jgi:hypothetical protein
MRLDAEVGQGLQKRFGGALDGLLGLSLCIRTGAPQDAWIGKLVPGVLRRRHVEDRLGTAGRLELEILELVDENGRRRWSLADDIRVRGLAVHGRRVRLRDRLVVERNADALDRAPGRHGRLLGGTGGMADDGADGCAGEEKGSGDDEEETEHVRAGHAEQAAEDERESLPGRSASLLSEQRHDPEAEDDEPCTKRAYVDQLSASDHEPSDDEEEERHGDFPVAEETREGRIDLVADVAAVPAEPERNGEEDAQEDECEPDELGVVLRAPPFFRERLVLRTRAGDFGRRCLGTLLRRHGRQFGGTRRAPASYLQSVRPSVTWIVVGAIGLLAALAVADTPAKRREVDAGLGTSSATPTPTSKPPRCSRTLRSEAVTGLRPLLRPGLPPAFALLPRMVDDVVRDEGGSDSLPVQLPRRPRRLVAGPRDDAAGGSDGPGRGRRRPGPRRPHPRGPDACGEAQSRDRGARRGLPVARSA